MRTAPDLYSALASLRTLGLTDWDEFFVEVSLCEQALSRDPVGAFAKMEKAAKSDYRNAVAELARKSGESEAEVARRAVQLAKQSARGTNIRANERALTRGLLSDRAKAGNNWSESWE